MKGFIGMLNTCGMPLKRIGAALAVMKGEDGRVIGILSNRMVARVRGNEKREAYEVVGG